MKLTTTMKNTEPSTHTLHRNIFPPVQRGVEVEFLPHLGWQAEVGRTPTKAFPPHQSKRDKAHLNRYKHPRGSSRLTHMFVPVELVIDAEQRRAECRQTSCRLALKSPTKL